MHRLVMITLLASACSVPDKQAPDAGVDAPGEDPEPETTITSSPGEFSNEAIASFSFASNVASATFACSIDDEDPEPCSSPFGRALADGPHAFSVRAITASGERDHSPSEVLWTIDTVAPQTRLVESPPAADNSVMVRFGFESDEENVEFDCSLDGGSYVACVSEGELGPVGDGAHAFAVRAHDRAGNVDASPAIYAWSVDTSTPDTQLLGGPAGASASTDATFSFSSSDAGAGATFQCAVDGGAMVACTSPYTVSNLFEGMHGFAVRVRDAVGNLDPTPATRTWVVDLTPPDTTITSGPTGTVATANAAIVFTSNETGVSYACSLDAAPYAACTSPQNLLGLAQGSHTFSVRATDIVGHVDASPATRTWTVDTLAPTVVFTAGPATGSTSGPRVSFGFTADEGVVACSLDSASFAACTSPVAFNAAEGPHVFRVRATDAAGNVTIATRSWTIVCTAPDATGAAGLLHLDDTTQTLVNAVVGGAPATLGDTVQVEPADPAPVALGRFGGALAFAASENDHVAWPAALGPTGALTLELWARPDVAIGTRDLVTSGDGTLAVSSVPDTATTVRISVTLAQSGTATKVVTSAAVAAGSWHHIVVAMAAPDLRLWVDGVLTAATGVKAGTAPVLDALPLGGTGARAYGGQLDEVRVRQEAAATDDAALGSYCPL